MRQPRWRGGAFGGAGAIFALAAANFAAGRLSLLLAVPPGYVTAVWPPAGIALAAALHYGPRIWPGIALGSFLINLSVGWDGAGLAGLASACAVAAGIAAASTLEALAGAALVRRAIGYPNGLTSERHIFLFQFLAGPVSCLIAPTLGLATLLGAGTLAAAGARFTWATWWVGDSIGVMLFAPLVLVGLGRPHALWVGRRVSVGVPLAAAITIAIGLFTYERMRETTQVGAALERRSRAFVNELRDTLHTNLAVVHSVTAFFAASVRVEPDEFRVFTADALRRHPAIQALEWAPCVTDAERAACEAEARQLHPGFRIVEAEVGGNLIVAARREEYFPVLYLEPFAGNQVALGFDLASEAVRRDALEVARAQGSATATAPIRLLQRPEGSDRGFLVLVPFYAAPDPARAARTLRGMAVAVYLVEDLIGRRTASLAADGIRLQIEDLSAPAGRRTLYSGGAPVARAAGPGAEAASADPVSAGSAPHAGPIWRGDLEVVGRRWSLTFAAGPEFLVEQRSWAAWAILAVGMLASATLGTFLLLLTGREADVANQVAERTAEIAAAQARIAAEATRRRRANEDLRALTARLEAILHSVDEGIQGMGCDGNILFENVAAARLLGHSSQEVIGHPSHPLMHHTRADGTPYPQGECLILETARTGVGREVDGEVFWRPDGTSFPVQYTTAPLRDAEGHVLGSVVAFRDVSERRRSEQALASLTAQLRSVLESATEVAVVATDLAGQVTLFNRGAELMLGYGRAEVVGQATPALFLEEAELRARAETLSSERGVTVSALESLLAAARDGGSETREGTCRGKTGARRTVNLSTTGIRDDGGRLIGFLLVATDISRRKELEAQTIRARSAAEAANRAKSWFLANMSHELRTPLNGIIGFSEVLEDQTFGPLNERQQRYLQHVLTSGRHLLQLINDVLDLSKLEVGKMVLEPGSMVLRTVLQESVMVMKARAVKSGIALELNTPEELSELRFVADERKLRQVLFNLIGNAVKFTPEGGTITVSTRILEEAGTQGGAVTPPPRPFPAAAGEGDGACAARGAGNGARLEIAVADTGSGIRPEDHERVFAPFEQVNSEPNRRQQGTGLGLTITRQLVELHGGTLVLESEGVAGKGSVFRVRLPLCAPETAAGSSSGGSADGGGAGPGPSAPGAG